jgi:hypothetical protein
MGDINVVKDVGRLAKVKRLNNIAFAASWQRGDTRSIVNLLVDTERGSKIALLARTYDPGPSCGQGSYRAGRGAGGEIPVTVGVVIAGSLRGKESELEEGWGSILHCEEDNICRETSDLLGGVVGRE